MKGKVFDTKKHSNIKRKAKYRQINKYTKSLPRHKKEAERNHQAYELYSKGYTIKQIAIELNISTRTVNRIKNKLSYKIERRFYRKMVQWNKKQQLQNQNIDILIQARLDILNRTAFEMLFDAKNPTQKIRAMNAVLKVIKEQIKILKKKSTYPEPQQQLFKPIKMPFEQDPRIKQLILAYEKEFKKEKEAKMAALQAHRNID